MTRYEPIDQTFLDCMAEWERKPSITPSIQAMQFAIFRMAHHIRNMHDAHEKAFQAGVDYQKAMERNPCPKK